MQKAPVLKGSGLQPVSLKSETETHIFGKNLEERVVAKDDEESPSTSFDSTQSNDLTKQAQEDDIDSIRKRKYDATTGEEDEETIFQGDFKLFVWNVSTSNWTEKGRGQLKLNISPSEMKSRLIMRVNGTLRIILNVSIKYFHFKIITDSKTSLRFTDSQTVWAVCGSNAQELKGLIEKRLEISKESDNTSQDDNEKHEPDSEEEGEENKAKKQAK